MAGITGAREELPVWAYIPIALRIITELFIGKQISSFSEIGCCQISANAIGLQAHDIGCRAKFRVAYSDMRMQTPAEAHPTLQIQHRRVIHDGGGCDQSSQNHSGF